MPAVPNQDLLSDERIPTVLLDGKRWPIPKLAPKQLEIITPIIMKRAERFKGKKPEEIGAEAMSEEGVKEMFTILYWGLQRGHRDLTLADFQELAIDLTELSNAVGVVTQQAFSFRPMKPGELPAPMGEAGLGPSPIGTA